MHNHASLIPSDFGIKNIITNLFVYAESRLLLYTAIDAELFCFRYRYRLVYRLSSPLFLSRLTTTRQHSCKNSCEGAKASPEGASGARGRRVFRPRRVHLNFRFQYHGCDCTLIVDGFPKSIEGSGTSIQFSTAWYSIWVFAKFLL
jgi:hypothetical protein